MVPFIYIYAIFRFQENQILVHGRLYYLFHLQIMHFLNSKMRQIPVAQLKMQELL